MHFEEKVNELSKIIDEQLLPIINKNGKVDECVYLDLPYHTNIGDILIWHGTEHFLKRTGIKCLYRASCSTFSKQKMKKITRRGNNSPCKEILIFLHGGGNFGDLWALYHDFRKKIIEYYSGNPIIILPQTVFYEDSSRIKDDVELFAKHKNLTICARDNKSYHLLKNNFRNKVILAPDMAFCIPGDELKRYQLKQENRTLLLKRRDKELNGTVDFSKIISETKFDIHDWPSMERQTMTWFFVKKLLLISRKVPIFIPKLIDIYVFFLFKPNMVKIGVKFVSRYSKIYTTRLHVAILCCLLGKSYVFLDNSYGKNSSFFETWLSDVDSIKFYHEHKNIDYNSSLQS